MLSLCFIAVAAAMAGLAVVGLSLGPLAGITAVLLAGPALGVVSLTSGCAAAAIAMRRYG